MLKTHCLFKLNNQEDAIQNNISLANYYVNVAEKNVQKDIQGAMRAESFFQKAINLYRNNGASKEAEKAHKRLVEIQKEIPKMMIPISVELNLKDIIENIKVNMEGTYI